MQLSRPLNGQTNDMYLELDLALLQDRPLRRQLQELQQIVARRRPRDRHGWLC